MDLIKAVADGINGFLVAFYRFGKLWIIALTPIVRNPIVIKGS